MIAGHSADFGGMVTRHPARIARPTTVNEVAQAVGSAVDDGLRVAVRGTGHGQGGQCLAEGGCVIDLSGLPRGIEVHGDTLTIRGGVTGRDLLDTWRRTGLLPPVMLDNPDISTLGAISSGGIGGASFRRGPLAAHCVEAQLVTADGEVVSAPAGSPKLRYARGGVGRFGILTQVTVRAVRWPSQLELSTWKLDAADALDATLSELAARAEVWHLVADVTQKRGGWVAEVTVAQERSVAVPRARRTGSVWLTPAELFVRYEDVMRAMEAPGFVHPWVEAFFPRAALPHALADLCAPLAHLGPEATLSVWPTAGADLPMLGQREGVDDALISFLPHTTPEGRAVQAAAAFHDACVALGGRRHLTGWFPRPPGGAERFGPAWPEVRAALIAADPDDRLGGRAWLEG